MDPDPDVRSAAAAALQEHRRAALQRRVTAPPQGQNAARRDAHRRLPRAGRALRDGPGRAAHAGRTARRPGPQAGSRPCPGGDGEAAAYRPRDAGHALKSRTPSRSRRWRSARTGKTLVSVGGTPSDSGEVRCGRSRPAVRASNFRGHAEAVTTVAFSPDGSIMATASGDPGPARLEQLGRGAGPPCRTSRACGSGPRGRGTGG